MKPYSFFTASILYISLITSSSAATPARLEIENLLATLKNSDCQFQRNGSWYSGSEASAHLLKKLDYIEQRKTINTTEEFIELAASKSSISDKPYQVKCGTKPIIESQTWLNQTLKELRKSTDKPKQ